MTDTTKPTLKPCPFCGYEAKLTKQKNTNLYYASCKRGKRHTGYSCKAHIGPYSGEWNAIENWNRHTITEDQIEAATAAFEKCMFNGGLNFKSRVLRKLAIECAVEAALQAALGVESE